MNDEVDNELAGRVQKAMSDDTSRLEQKVTQRLHASRSFALERMRRDARRVSFLGMQKLVPGVIFACSLFVVVGVGLVKIPKERPSSVRAVDTQTLIEQVDTVGVSSAELELVEELEFYEWLEAHGHAG